MLFPPNIFMKLEELMFLIVVSDTDLIIKRLGYINYMEVLYAVIFICIATIIYQIKVVIL